MQIIRYVLYYTVATTLKRKSVYVRSLKTCKLSPKNTIILTSDQFVCMMYSILLSMYLKV